MTREVIDKRAIRAAARERRDALFVGGKPAIRVPDAFLALLSRGLTVASYVPIGSEADPSPLARAAVEAGCAIVLPHVTTRAEPMRFLAWDTGAALVAGPMGLHQPADTAEERAPDIVLTPLVAFDRAGNRVGQGAGHYDRAFDRFPDARRIGIALSVQEIAVFAPDPWDRPLHAIATEQEWIEP